MTRFDLKSVLSSRHAVPAVLLSGAALVRVAVTWATLLSFLYPDELFQYLEQAHRIVFGYGVVTWEYRLGLRSWLYPLLLSVPMRIGGAVDPGGWLYLLLPRVCAALSSLTIVWAAYVLGRRRSPTHAVIAAFVAAVWFDFILYAAHGLTEALSFNAFILGVVLVSSPGRRAWWPVGAGIAFGLAAVLRFQYLPAIGVFLLCSRLPLRCWGQMAAGAVAVALVSAAVDLGAGQTPFGWLVENVRLNLAGKADLFGVAPAWAYVAEMMRRWSFWLLPIALLAGLGARTHRPLLWAALANLAFHMAIPHKEYRFIFLTTSIVVLLAALGTADAVMLARRRWPTVRAPVWTMGASALWLAASIGQALAAPVFADWTTGSPMLHALAEARRIDATCGVTVYRTGFWRGASYAVLHRTVPLYLVAPPTLKGVDDDPAAALRRLAPVSNVVIAAFADRREIDPRYRRRACHASLSDESPAACVFVRPGACAPPSTDQQAHEINQVLRRTGW